VDGGDDRLGAVDHVVDEVARLAHDARAHGIVADHLVEQVERAAGGEALACALDEGDAHVRIAVDDLPHVGKLPVHVGTDRVESRSFHHHPQHSGGRAFELQARERGVRVGSGHVRILF